MRRYSVKVTDAAERDLSDIAGYLQARLESPGAAASFLDGFERLVGDLETLPSVHPRVRDGFLAEAGYRWSPIGSYMAFFTIDEPDATVVVERVLHGTRNWKTIV